MVRRGTTRVVGVLVMVLGWVTGPAVGAERYYVLIFGAQPSPKIIKDSHTWATFIRVVGEGADPAGYQVIAHTISIVPATLRVRTLALDAEPGRNLNLEETLAYARDRAANVTAWGPFLIRPDVYQKSLEVWALVSSGAVRYRAIDSICNVFISDCIHAVSAVDPKFGREHYPLIRTGKSASRYIARQIVKRIDPNRVEPDEAWLITALGLDRHPVEIIFPNQIPQRRSILAPRGD